MFSDELEAKAIAKINCFGPFDLCPFDLELQNTGPLKLDILYRSLANKHSFNVAALK